MIAFPKKHRDDVSGVIVLLCPTYERSVSDDIRLVLMI